MASAKAMAGTENAPILLTSKDELSGDIERWVNRNQTGKAFIVGVETAISPKVESTLKLNGIETERITGATRQDTTASIASYISKGEKSSTVVIASSLTPWDSLSISPYSNSAHSPVFLTNQDGTLSEKIIKAIKATGTANAIIMGGLSAVKPEAQEKLQGSFINYNTKAIQLQMQSLVQIQQVSTGVSSPSIKQRII